MESTVPSRYYFDAVKDDDVIRDEHGVEANNVADVIEQAKLGLEELRQTLRLGESEGWTLIIRDDKGNNLHRLPI
ncbi:DUF6894 family protein [Methylobacterium sp. C25]|uniref:DUF6894 family protein n=1 Tax=Methylobacterium sp. C25 TaxID=2721622 RepID=UPI003FA37B56